MTFFAQKRIFFCHSLKLQAIYRKARIHSVRFVARVSFMANMQIDFMRTNSNFTQINLYFAQKAPNS